MSEPKAAHEREARRHATARPVRCAVLTVSDTRSDRTDEGGPLAAALLAEAGHDAGRREIVRDDPPAIRAALAAWLADPEVDAIVTTGGTGIAPRDTTVEIVAGLLTRPLPGFGELFRMLSWEQVGAAAMLSRAVGGLVEPPAAAGTGTFIFAVPGSPAAVRLAVERLIAPQLAHLAWQRSPAD
ncbi:MAG: MogA/MoaB family molybdenum cofactor biosynthesis protein [Planctomycetota bacterium]|jgi:molybdenum cofactor biosynthesis protein B